MKLLLILLMVISPLAVADGATVGADCTISWTPGTTGGPASTFNIYIGTSATNKVKVGNTPATSIACSALTPPPGAGQNYVDVTGVNVAGEGAHSTTIPFVVVTSVPGAPGGVTVVPK